MRRLTTLFLLIFAVAAGTAYAQQMTDNQVMQYVMSAQQAGKSQKQIAIELMRQGVSQEQLMRIKNSFTKSASTLVDDQDGMMVGEKRTRQRPDLGDKKPGQLKGIRASVVSKTTPLMAQPMADSLSMMDNMFISPIIPMEDQKDQKEQKDPTQQIFGHSIFTNENLSFEPPVNVPTPENYKMGPGDEVIIDVWGASETTIRQVISPEGSIQVMGLGPVYLNGKTVNEANNYLKQEFAKIYSGVTGNETQVKMTLGELRSILVNVMGEVAIPGTYTLSSFATVFHALYCAGGVNDIGSLRSIKVMRGGVKIADVDVYDLLMKGKMKDDIRLQDGDVVLVSPYQSLVHIQGKVKRPMFYELKPDETAGTLLEYAGGFKGDAYKKAVRVVRKSGRERQIFNVDEMDFSVFRMDDGDEMEVDSVLERFANRVEIRGAVYREGLYQIDGETNTVKALIEKAEGLRGDAFLNRAIIDRERDDYTHEMIQVDIRGMMNGTAVDIPLQKNDILYIPSIHDLQEEPTLTIHGEIADPGTYYYSENMTVEDLILQAGGLLESAATTKIEVARRVKDPRSNSFSTKVGESYSFDLKDELSVAEVGTDFYLQPFDEVYIRKSPSYHKQQNVIVEGEVLFGGSYALSKKNERLSDLIKKAGGVTPDAYVRGARLIRNMTSDEIRRKQDAVKMAQLGADNTVTIDTLTTGDIYSVGINLERALENPGSDADMVLRDGDVLYVPEYVSTVKINGAVMYPNTVLYKPGEDYRYYIDQAGGFGSDARRHRAYVVYMNGTVARLKKSNKRIIEPGCEIIVPKRDEKRRMSTSEVISLGTSLASLAAVVASVINLVK